MFKLLEFIIPEGTPAPYTARHLGRWCLKMASHVRNEVSLSPSKGLFPGDNALVADLPTGAELLCNHCYEHWADTALPDLVTFQVNLKVK